MTNKEIQNCYIMLSAIKIDNLSVKAVDWLDTNLDRASAAREKMINTIKKIAPKSTAYDEKIQSIIMKYASEKDEAKIKSEIEAIEKDEETFKLEGEKIQEFNAIENADFTPFKIDSSVLPDFLIIDETLAFFDDNKKQIKATPAYVYRELKKHFIEK